MLLSTVVLLRSRGVSPKLFLISALFNQNSSMRSVFLTVVSSGAGSFKDSSVRFSEAGLAKGVEVTAGTG